MDFNIAMFVTMQCEDCLLAGVAIIKDCSYVISLLIFVQDICSSSNKDATLNDGDNSMEECEFNGLIKEAEGNKHVGLSTNSNDCD